MVFNIHQFESEQAELDYWKNLAQTRGEALEKANKENEHMQEVFSQARALHRSKAHDLSNLQRKYESLEESYNKLKVTIHDFQIKMNKIEEKIDKENCEMKKRITKIFSIFFELLIITKLEREISEFIKKVELQAKKIWKP